MADQNVDVAQLFQGLAVQLNNLTGTIKSQGAGAVPSFSGEVKGYKEWIKSVEKYALLTEANDNQTKLIAYRASSGAVSDFIHRYIQNHPNNNWNQLKAELATRFSEITDAQHAFSLLRGLHQRPSETVQVFAERLMGLAQEAFANQAGGLQAVEPQLVGFFTDGLLQDTLKLKVMRDNPNTLQGAITTAMTEQNLRKRFELRSGNRTHGGASNGPEPMEIDHMRRSGRCYKCNRSGHKAKDCRVRQLNLVETYPKCQIEPLVETRRCYNCNQQGHLIRDCPHKAHRPQGQGRRYNQPQLN